MSIDEKSLYDLTPSEFEKLCAEILKKQGLQNVTLVGGPKDQGVDIIAETEGQRIAIQVKHSKQLSLSSIRRIIQQVQESSYQPKHLFIITSATISSSLKESIQGLPSHMIIRLMGRDEVLEAVNRHPEIQRSYFASARRRTVRQRIILTFSTVGALASIAGMLLTSIFYFFQPQKTELQDRIETVEQAIGSLKDLEKHLTDIKRDMVETEKAARAIEQEYAKAKELEKITEDEFEAVKAALRSKSWKKTAIDYILGFILGVAASLSANVIYSRIRQRRALSE